MAGVYQSLFGKAPSVYDSMEADSLIEVILWLKTFKIRMENHFTELGETTFFQLRASQFILQNHFTKSAENHFSLNFFLAELLMYSGEN